MSNMQNLQLIEHAIEISDAIADRIADLVTKSDLEELRTFVNKLEELDKDEEGEA